MRANPVALFFFLITVATTLYEFYRDASIRERFLFSPYLVWHERQWYRIFTCTLVHADMAHLAFNMITYYFFAFQLEYIFTLYIHPFWGHAVFALVYVGAMVGAHVPEVFRQRHNPTYRAVGASGAISAVLFSFIIYEPNVTLLVFFVIPLQAWMFALLYVVISLLADRFSKGDGIAHGAHLWGALSGWLLTAIIDPASYARFLEILQARLL